MSNRRTTFAGGMPLSSMPLNSLNRQSLGPGRISNEPVKSRVSLAGGMAMPQMMTKMVEVAAANAFNASNAASTATTTAPAAAALVGSSRMSMGGARRASIGVGATR